MLIVGLEVGILMTKNKVKTFGSSDIEVFNPLYCGSIKDVAIF